MAAKNSSCIAVTGENKDILVVFNKKFAFLHDLNKEGELMKPILVCKEMAFGGISIAAGNKH